MRATQLIKRVGMDVAVWCCIPSVFLFFYVHFHAISSDAIGPHLYLVLISLLSLTLIRLTLCRLIPGRRVAHTVTSCVISAVLMSMLLYYVLVLVGLGSWARVISWDLITSYTIQLPGLIDSLGFSVYLVSVLFAIGYAALTYATHAYIKRFDWVSLLLPEISGGGHLFIVTAGFAICAIALYHFILSPPIQKSEPLSLTFFPMAAARNLQGHAVDRLMAEKLDRLEDAVRSAYETSKETTKKNLVLIVVDALRPDHMGIYGYQRDTTPNITNLTRSRQGYAVNNVRASCGDSLCGLLSLASSKFLHQFSNRPFTLQQVLRRQGYRIEMILGGDHTSFYGLKELYGEVDSYFDGSMTGGGYYVNDDQLVLDYTKRLPAWDGKPVMMQFHLMSAHVLGKRHDSFAKYSPSANYALPGKRTDKNREAYVNFYDNGVVQADAVIHSLLEMLQSKGYLKNTLVVITADHGESLGEHGLYAHANSVREEALRIPLILIPYGYQSNLCPEGRAATSQVDIAPTILTDFGFSIPNTWFGISMQSSQRNSYSYFQEGQAAGLIDHRDSKNVWKYWFDAETGSEYAFNLAHDSAEKDNLANQAPSHLKRDWRLQQMQQMRGMQGGKKTTTFDNSIAE